MEPKRQKLETDVGDDIVELNAFDIIRFRFGESADFVPDFVHQNFGQIGKILWLNQFMPLSILIDVDIKDKMQCKATIKYGGDQDSPIARDLARSLLRKLKSPCELGEGCRPAAYPGSLSDSIVESDGTIQPSSTSSLPNGFRVERYASLDFHGKSLSIWRRTEWLMLWFIESVSQSDHEHDKFWEYYFLRSSDGEIVSMCSVYKFPSFTFLEEGLIGERIRLSQFLTIPSKRKGGYGSMLLRFLAETVLFRGDVDYLTMEDPSFGMTSMRETVYLQIAKEAGLLESHMDIDDMVTALKIPRIFAKRMKNLLEMNHVRGDRKTTDEIIDKVINSGNVYVKKFIDSIEFFAESEEPIPEESKASMIREKVGEALCKLEKSGA